MNEEIRTCFFLLVFVLSSCRYSDYLLAKKMLEKYSNDQNYVELSGEIIESNKNTVVIKCTELKNYRSSPDEICTYYIYSNQILDLASGDHINFVTVPFHFYNGHKFPIVELKIDGNTLLEFEEGKENLIEWVKLTFM